ncbi:hypothetical protein WJX75_002914 [Coccomyxa subellipsoidea]|uniref:BSD domain-containing protein n=1 Tax=Coccomyxa subellipsoidea TaxID=248742 RepID=A0ABR2YBT3_9CHLO
MSKSEIAGKSSRGTSWQHQAAASSLHEELSATHASGDVKDPNTESMPSFQQASTSETAGFWRNAVQAVSKVFDVADHTLAGIFGVNQSKYSLYEADLDVPAEVAMSSRQSSTTSSWLKWSTAPETDEEDAFDIEAPKHTSAPRR